MSCDPKLFNSLSNVDREIKSQDRPTNDERGRLKPQKQLILSSLKAKLSKFLYVNRILCEEKMF